MLNKAKLLGVVSASIQAADSQLMVQAEETSVLLASGASVSLAASGKALLRPSQTMTLSATGIAPNTELHLMLVPTARYGISSFMYESASVMLLDSATASRSGTAVLTADLSVPQGDYQLQLVGVMASGEIFTLAIAAEIRAASLQESEPEIDLSLAVWTKKISATQVKMYAKNVTGKGKIQFLVNDAEVAWVRASDNMNPKLRNANGSYDLVRTIALKQGKTALEFYQDGERIRRNAYSVG